MAPGTRVRPVTGRSYDHKDTTFVKDEWEIVVVAEDSRYATICRLRDKMPMFVFLRDWKPVVPEGPDRILELFS